MTAISRRAVPLTETALKSLALVWRDNLDGPSIAGDDGSVNSQETVYLLHFERPIGNPGNAHGSAQHYLGYTNDLDRRLREHLSGNGSPLVRAVTEAGIPILLVRTWHGSRVLERRLKGLKNSPRLCPICRTRRVDEACE